jgi:anti-sigma B factor antagonist
MFFSTSLTLNVEPREEARLISLAGELDYGNADKLRDELMSARADGVTALVDMAAISFIDGAGLTVLLEASDAANSHDWAWFLLRPSPVVTRLLEVSGTGPRVPVVLIPVTPESDPWTAAFRGRSSAADELAPCDLADAV